jgi:hypothetical protein
MHSSWRWPTLNESPYSDTAESSPPCSDATLSQRCTRSSAPRTSASPHCCVGSCTPTDRPTDLLMLLIAGHPHMGVGDADDGIDHNENPLRFPYVSEFYRSHYLHPHPYRRRQGTSAQH